MATKKANIFENAVAKRQQEQEQIAAVVTGKMAAVRDTGRVKKRGADATTITLSISREDKALVRALAEKRGASISDLLHQWIREASKE